MNKPLICFDIESTGKDPAKDRIVQIAYCEICEDPFDPDKLMAFNASSVNILINPGVPIPAEATAIHGITNDDVYGKPNFQEVAMRLYDRFKGCDLVGFNLTNFDVLILWEELYRVGITWDLSDTRIIDCGTLFKRREERTLSAAVQFYCGREHTEAHDAMGDVVATCNVLTAQIERYRLDPKDREQLERESNYEEKRVDLAGKIIVGKDGRPTYNIGKVKCIAVEDDPGFAVWMLDKDFSENTKQALRDILYAPKEPQPEPIVAEEMPF